LDLHLGNFQLQFARSRSQFSIERKNRRPMFQRAGDDLGVWANFRAMYVIDARHYLDDKGNIAPGRGAARKMADFVTSVIAHASD
jgi:hypothetical protein